MSRAALSLYKKINLQNYFFKSVGVLVGSTAFAQILSVLALPILTRLYTPDDFNALAVYSAILNIIAAASCLRLELAIPLPKSDSVALNLLALSLISCSTVSFFVLLSILIFPKEITDLVGQSSLLPYLWLLPIGILLAGFYSAFLFWATRKKNFPNIAKTKIKQAAGGIATQLILGGVGVAPFGLLLGQLISSGAGFVGLANDKSLRDRSLRRSITWLRMRAALSRYDKFPKYSTLEVLSNNAGIQLPLIIIASLTSGPEAGFLMLAMRVMQGPLGMIGGATAQVFLSQAPEELREGRLSKYTSVTTNRLCKFGVGPIVLAGLIAPNLFSWIFGEEWRRSGELAMWMIPWLVMQLLASPISMVMHICGKQRAMLILTVLGLLIRCGAVLIASFYGSNRLPEIYAASGAVFYSACLYIFFKVAGLKAGSLFYIVAIAVLCASAGGGVAILFNILIDWSAKLCQ